MEEDYPALVMRIAEGGRSRIFGALDDYRRFSKAQLIAEIVREQGLNGPEFVGMADGPVEIGNTKRVDGIAVGVASDEARRTGIEEWKRKRLVEAGADLIVADFAEAGKLVAYLWGDEDVV